jgi:hypothetical protein
MIVILDPECSFKENLREMGSEARGLRHVLRRSLGLV